MAVQARSNNSNYQFIIRGGAYDLDGQTLAQDAGRTTDVAPFTVFGKKLSAVPTTGTADAGNTGDGTCTAVAQLGGTNAPAVVGAYNLECTDAVTNGGVFKLEDPNGNLLASGLTMTAGAGAATVFNAGGLAFTLTDGATDFASGDKFAITVTAVNKLTPLDPAAVDGAQLFAGIYTQQAIATADIVAGDVSDIKIITGGESCLIDEDMLVFENSVTLATIMPDGQTLQKHMEMIGIFTVDTQDIDGYENA